MIFNIKTLGKQQKKLMAVLKIKEGVGVKAKGH